nr:MAG TPA: hypothetical protein [Caudoviricetes sp.]
MVYTISKLVDCRAMAIYEQFLLGRGIVSTQKWQNTYCMVY